LYTATPFTDKKQLFTDYYFPGPTEASIFACIKTKEMENNNRHPVQSHDGKLIIGAILILIGTLIMLANFDFIDANVSYYIFSWKSLLIFLGLVLLGAKTNKTPGYILVGIGVFFWLPSFFDYDISLSDVFWPLLLIGLGLVLINRQRPIGGRHHAGGPDGDSGPNGYLDDVSIFGGGIKIIQSKNFKGGNITAIFGGSEFDLRQVEMATDVAVIDVFTLFGGTKIVVPESWSVKPDAISILGGLSDKRVIHPNQEEGKTLVIKGLVMLGGVEIKSF
jgi:predicted membrane protein